MSWLFSQALVAEYSVDSSLAGELSAQSSVMPTAQPFWRRGKTMEPSSPSRFGQTFAPLTEEHGVALLTSFLAASHARTSAQQERGQASRVRDRDCGLSSRGSFARWSRSSCGWRTVQRSLLGGSMSFSGTWPRSGSMRSGVCSERPTSASRTGASGYGFSLPTPSGVNGGRNHTMGRVDEWGGSSNPLRGTVIGSMCLPEFEELVMGWPIGWTAPTPYATDRFHAWSLMHGVSCMRACQREAA